MTENAISGWALEGSITLNLTGKAVGGRWRRFKLAWAVLRGKAVQPTVNIIGNQIVASPSGGIALRAGWPITPERRENEIPQYRRGGWPLDKDPGFQLLREKGHERPIRGKS